MLSSSRYYMRNNVPNQLEDLKTALKSCTEELQKNPHTTLIVWAECMSLHF